jgi:hypothetical protein
MSKRFGNKNSQTHGLTNSPEWRSWSAMRSRCLNPNYARYDLYGGRGISICERWNAFENFLEDMGPRPQGTSLDRINNNVNYEPDNCRWADALTQRHNQRRHDKKFGIANAVLSFGV